MSSCFIDNALRISSSANSVPSESIPRLYRVMNWEMPQNSEETEVNECSDTSSHFLSWSAPRSQMKEELYLPALVWPTWHIYWGKFDPYNPWSTFAAPPLPSQEQPPPPYPNPEFRLAQPQYATFMDESDEVFVPATRAYTGEIGQQAPLEPLTYIQTQVAQCPSLCDDNSPDTVCEEHDSGILLQDDSTETRNPDDSGSTFASDSSSPASSISSLLDDEFADFSIKVITNHSPSSISISRSDSGIGVEFPSCDDEGSSICELHDNYQKISSSASLEASLFAGSLL